MRRFAIAVLFFTVPLLASCEKRLFHFVLNYDKTFVYAVDETGPFEYEELVSADEIRSTLDIPEDARITGVDVEALSVKVVVRPENQVTNLVVSGKVVETPGGKTSMFNNFPIVLAGVDTPFIGLNDLIASGIGRLKSKLQGFIMGLDSQSFGIELSGDSVPSGQALAVDIHLLVKATIKYEQCVEVLSGFMDGEKCDTE
jgi:hypothetical protein